MLTLKPKRRGDTAQFFQPQRHFWSDRRFASQNAVQRLPRDQEIPRGLCDRQMQRRQHLSAKDCAGMCIIGCCRLSWSLHACVTRDVSPRFPGGWMLVG